MRPKPVNTRPTATPFKNSVSDCFWSPMSLLAGVIIQCVFTEAKITPQGVVIARDFTHLMSRSERERRQSDPSTPPATSGCVG